MGSTYARKTLCSQPERGERGMETIISERAALVYAKMQEALQDAPKIVLPIVPLVSG